MVQSKHKEIYHYYKQHFMPPGEDKWSKKQVTKKGSNYSLVVKLTWLEDYTKRSCSRDVEGSLYKLPCALSNYSKTFCNTVKKIVTSNL